MTSQADRFAQLEPQGFFLDGDQPLTLQRYLHDLGHIDEQRRIEAVSKAGEGNMNLVLRVCLDDGTGLVVKQSRPWVEKFPDIEAPSKRADTEALYYRQTVSEPRIAARSPRVIGSDETSHILLLEDLGNGTDLTDIYSGQARVSHADIQDLGEYLSALHGRFLREHCDFFIGNDELRELNAVHMFRFPYDENSGFDLNEITPGLACEAQACREDHALMSLMQQLDKRYLQGGQTLLHGDFFPGSFLRVDGDIKVIDPEFCFFGDAEFDLGILLAHLMLGRQPEAVIQQLFLCYQAPPQFSLALCRQYAGVEILRRLLGLAQLPLTMSLAEKKALIAQAKNMLMAESQTLAGYNEGNTAA